MAQTGQPSDAYACERCRKAVYREMRSDVYLCIFQWFVLVVGALLGLLMFASPVAIGAVFSIGAIAQYVAFTLPIALKLFVVGDKFRPGNYICASRVVV